MGEALAATATAILLTVGSTAESASGHTVTAGARLHLLLVNENVTPANVVTRAQADVVRMFSQIGVQVEWLTEPLGDGRRVHVVKLTDWEPSGRRLSGALGLTVLGDRSRRAYVIWSRVRSVALRSAVPYDAMLAVAIAHEIGHILLPHNAHGKHGLMRESWDANDLRSAAAGLLGFSRESAVQIALAMRSEVTVAGR